ncbi:hypothetical protein LCGC14_2629920, partial [marine sediment metagenome]
GLAAGQGWREALQSGLIAGGKGALYGAAIGAAVPVAIRGAQMAGRGISRAGQRVGQSWSRFMHRGPGRAVGLGRKFLRTLWEDRLTFNASRDFFRRWRGVFGQNTGRNRWSLEHNFIKQKQYRGSNPTFEPGTVGNRLLQGLGDSGLNLVPIPARMNTWLYHHRFASVAFNYIAVPAAAAGIVYGSPRLGSWIGENLADALLDDEESP